MSVSTTVQTSPTTSTFQRRGLSLRLRLSLLVLALSLVAFAIVAVAIQDQARDVLTQAANEKLESNTNALRDNVLTWLDLSAKALQTLASQPAVASMDPAQQKPYLQAMQKAFEEQTSQSQPPQPAMYLVSTTDLTGLNVARSDEVAAKDYSSREWFKGAKNGEAITFQTVKGQTTQRPALAAGVPITRDQRIVGVAMFASELPSIGEAVNANRIGGSGRVYIFDTQDRAVAFVDPTLNSNDIITLTDKIPIPIQALRSGAQSPYVYNDENGIRWHAYLKALPNNWGIIVQQQEGELLAPLHQLQAFIFLAFGLGAVSLAVVMGFAVGRSLRPINQVAAEAIVAAGGNLNVVVPVKHHDEVGALAFAFNTMIDRLRDLIGSLEERVAARTEQLHASADVGRAAVSILDTDQLLHEVVNLITNRFGFYYAAVFLGDTTDKWAVLHEATGEAGRILKEQHHRLEVGGQSMVGAVMKTRKARIALDVGEEAVRFANPLLPDTRSEIALPLLVGSRILGVLDVQSTVVHAFDEANAAVLQSMADQIAIALSNTLQFQQAQTSLRRTRQLYEVSTAIANTPDAAGLLNELLTKAVVDASVAQLLLYGPRDELGQYAYFEVGASWTADNSVLALPVGTRLNPEQVPPISALAGEPYIVRDISDPTTPPDQRRLLGTMRMRAMLGYALVAESQPVGLLLMFFNEPHAFPVAETQPLQALVGQVAMTLRNQQLVQEQALARQQLDEVNRRLTGQNWQQYLKSSGGAVRKVDVGPGAPDQTNAASLPATLSAPVLIHGQEIGMLRLEDATPAREWTPNEIALIQAVAGEVAIAVENARLIEQTERRAQREARLNQIAQELRQATDIQSILQTATEQLSLVLDTSHAQAQLGKRTDGEKVQS